MGVAQEGMEVQEEAAQMERNRSKLGGLRPILPLIAS